MIGWFRRLIDARREKREAAQIALELSHQKEIDEMEAQAKRDGFLSNFTKVSGGYVRNDHAEAWTRTREGTKVFTPRAAPNRADDWPYLQVPLMGDTWSQTYSPSSPTPSASSSEAHCSSPSSSADSGSSSSCSSSSDSSSSSGGGSD
jgi:hypothetical protein